MPAGNFISLGAATVLTSSMRTQQNIILNPAYQGIGVIPVCETFNRSLIDAVLQQEGCTGLRLYQALDASLKLVTVIVGVDQNNADMLPSPKGDNNYQIIEQGQRCPDDCPPPSPLNS